MSERRGKTVLPRRSGLVASATVMAQHPQGLRRLIGSEQWQGDVWRYYDEVGELRFGVGWLANGMSRVNLVAARQPESLGDEPRAIIPQEGVEFTGPEQLAHDLVSAIAGGAMGQGQMLSSISTLLTIPGEAWVLMESDVDVVDPEALLAPTEFWTWRVLASEELRAGERVDPTTGQMVYEVHGDKDENDWIPVREGHVLVRIWHRHPRKGWTADSPCRAVLTVLRQIHLLDEYINAVSVSRLAGAGLLIMPEEVEIVPMVLSPAQPDIDLSAPGQSFVDVLIDTMSLATTDRGSAAAIVPIVIRVPGEYIDKIRHITFWSEFSDVVLQLREAAIKRLALGLDMPPEVLLGMGQVNHWGQWAIEETAITLHIEPQAETITHGLTVGYLQPALMAAGVSEPEARDFLVWYDTTDLTTRPDRSADTINAYDRLEASGAALRRESGLGEDDAPSDEELHDRRLWILAQTATGAPFASELLDGNGPPPIPANIDQVNASAIIEACDGLVHRALERAGSRLRSAAGRHVNGGAASLPGDNATLHTRVTASKHDINALLANAWTRVPEVADRIGWDSASLERTLDTYTRALLATGHDHSCDRLAHALGLAVTR